MKDRAYLLNTILAVVLGITMLAIMLVRTFLPAIIIPKAGIPNLVLLSLIALILDYYLAKGVQRCWICVFVFSAVSFALLPWIIGYTSGSMVWKLGLAGGVVFTAVTWLFSTICDRLSSGPACKAAPIVSAVGLYLAAQCFASILL